MQTRGSNAGSADLTASPADIFQSEGVLVLRSQRWLASGRRLTLIALAICLAGFGWAIAFKPAWLSGSSASTAAADNLDQQLQRAATVALGDRRGTIIVMDPQTGRVRAVVNAELAFAENLPPGSTIKPFTALAALRSGVIDEDSRTVCHEKYAHQDFHTTCSHPRDLPPLNPTDAIAYSCNYYFGKVGERLSESNFSSTLNEFGFGKASGVNADREATGSVRRSDWQSENAIGEGDYLRATPIQLLDAYSALVNGGHLFTPRIARASGYVPELRTNIAINGEHRNLILKGMRGAVRYGTAETAGLYSLPIYVFGKTGTATEIDGFRTQGWFVGFASALNENAHSQSEISEPEEVKLAVLVFLAKAHGSDAAEVARPIFAEYARMQDVESESTNLRSEISNLKSQIEEEKSAISNGNSEMSNLRSQISNLKSQNQTPVPGSVEARNTVSGAYAVRVHLVRENITRTLPLEDYIRGVVAAEGSMESEPEALKALAIASRTFVLKNQGRHAKDGYDFCTTTHCQRYHPTDSSDDVSAAVSGAVEATRGEVLLAGNDELADSYFSASCGGATANLATLWGGNAPAYLRGVRDDYCTSEAHHDWTDLISQAQLLKALQTDPRTNIGERLLSVSVLRKDSTGRAELIGIEGNRRITIKGWDFKIIVGRALGWNLLKSSRFEISRAGSNFVFRGSGFGHGLGLCQEGAHVMAERGASYRQILRKYFPSTRVANNGPSTAADLIWEPGPQSGASTTFFNSSQSNHAGRVGKATRQTLRSEDFRINYPSDIGERDVTALLSFLQSSRKSLVARVAAAKVNAQFPVLEIFVNETTGDFVGRTGLPAWAAAATRGNQIEIQPLETLRRRRILETTLRHELVHTMIDVVSRGRAPRWLAEGLALNLAGEGPLVSRYEPRKRMTTGEIDKRLGYSMSMVSPEEMRMVYAAAYGEVRRLIKSEGEASVWRRVAKSS